MHQKYVIFFNSLPLQGENINSRWNARLIRKITHTGRIGCCSAIKAEFYAFLFKFRCRLKIFIIKRKISYNCALSFVNLVNYTKRPLAVQGCSTKFPIFYFIFTVCIFFVVNLRDVEKRLTLRWDFRCVCFNLANLLFSSLLLSSYRTIFNFFRGSPAWIQLMAPVTIDCSTVISSECFKWKKKTNRHIIENSLHLSE